ncbi:MAG: carboxylating nicotinate-nucleotide diphosphorylase [Betaproteobacteria bacterium]
MKTSIPVPADMKTTVQRALAEDIGEGDLTAQLVPAAARATAIVITREPCVVCGAPYFDEAMHQVDPATTIAWHVSEGDSVPAKTKLCTVTGAARSLLTTERTSLNLLQTLSATATATRRHVDAVAGTRARVVETRKTIPGLRLAQKYAVVVGGGANNRIGLFDGILIKENHIMAAGGIARALEAARAQARPGTMIQIEVESIAQLEEAIAAGAKMILLDNFTPERMAEAVRISAGRAELEASGGIDLSTIRTFAETGVDRISVGTLTKDIKAVDLSMRFSL